MSISAWAKAESAKRDAKTRLRDAEGDLQVANQAEKEAWYLLSDQARRLVCEWSDKQIREAAQ